MAEGELHAEREAADLGPQLAPSRAGRLDLADLSEHAPGITGIDKHRGDHHRALIGGGDRLQPRNGGRHSLGQHEHAAACLAKGAGERPHLALVGQTRWHGNAVLAVVLLEGGGGEADGACPQRLEDDRTHPGDLGVGGRPAAGFFPQHVRAHGRVSDEGRHVRHHAPALERGEVVGIGLEIPVDPGPERLQRHALDVRQVADDQISVGGPAGGDCEPAVADNHRGHAERGRRRRVGVPGELGVVVRVDIDVAGGEHEPVPVHALARRGEVVPTAVGADGGDASGLNGEGAFAGGRPGTVDDAGIDDHEVVHDRSLLLDAAARISSSTSNGCTLAPVV